MNEREYKYKLIDAARKGDEQAFLKLIEIYRYIGINFLKKKNILDQEALTKTMEYLEKLAKRFINEKSGYKMAEYIYPRIKRFNPIKDKTARHTTYIKEAVITNLSNSAKYGDVKAKEELFLKNQDRIIRYASKTYAKIKQIYVDYLIEKDDYSLYLKEEYKYINNNNYEDIYNGIPDNIISLEDIISDFYVRAGAILDSYVKANINLFFSTYLDNRLSYYMNKYIEDFKLRLNNNDDYDYMNNNNLENNSELRKQILDNIEKDYFLRMYKDFLITIFSLNDYEEIKKETGLETRLINQKIKIFGKVYNKRLKNK